MLRRLAAMIRKELSQLGRDVPLLMVLFWAFGGSIYVHGHGVSSEIRNYPIVVLDLSRSPASREFVARLHAPYFRIVGYADSDRDIVADLDAARASAAVVIPADFERQLRAGRAGIQVVADGTLSTSATIAGAHLATITNEYNMYLVSQHGRRQAPAPQIDARIRVAYNPNQTSAWFTSVLELLNMTTEVSILLTAAALVREKERGTLEQLLVTPLRPAELFAAKIAPTMIVVLLLSMFALFGLIQGVFHTPVRGSVALFYAVTALYVFALSSLGLVIAAVARNIAQAMMVLLLILFPMLMLSGARNPPETMEPWMRYLSLISPMRYYIDFGYQVLFKGNGLAYVWRDLLGIGVIGALTFAAAVARFRGVFHR
jgi:ABC-2 type transport system permease protein